MSDVEEVKSRLNIVDIVQARVPLKKAGRNFKGLCPFHSEKSPSFMVSPERQAFHCFGCGKGGSVIDFVMEMEHLSFIEALEDLAEKAGVKLTHKASDSQEDQQRQKIYEVNHLASEYYQYVLTKHALGEKARLYLKGRGVTDKTMKTFALGYSPNSWDALGSFLKKKGYDAGLLEKAGLQILSARGGYDRFRGRVMFTLKDHRGNVVGFSGRLLDPNIKDLPAGRQEAKYINTSETPVYSKSHVLYGLDVTREAIQKAGEAIIVEGEFDVISPFAEGIGNVVAIKGSALTEGHIRLLKRYTQKLVLALDSDLAGDAAARRGIELADAAGLELKVATMPIGKDPDEAARESPGALKSAIKDAVPIYDYYIASVQKRFDPSSASGKKHIAGELLPILSKIENSIVQAHYIKIASRLLSVSEDVLGSEIRKLKVQGAHVVVSREKEEDLPTRSRVETLEMYVLALMLQGKPAEFLEEFKEVMPLEDITLPPVRRLIELLETFMQNHRIFLLKDFADVVPSELAPVLDEALLWDVSEATGDEEKLSKEWTTALRELKRAELRRKIANISTTMEAQKLQEAGMDGSAEDANRLAELTAALLQLDKGS